MKTQCACAPAKPPVEEVLATWDRWVWKQARRWHGTFGRFGRFGLTTGDLRGEFVLAILRGYAAWDPARGAFSTWAAVVMRSKAHNVLSHLETVTQLVTGIEAPGGDRKGGVPLVDVEPDARRDGPLETAIGSERRERAAALVRAALPVLTDDEFAAVESYYWHEDDSTRPMIDRAALRSAHEKLRLALTPPDGERV